MGRNEDCLEVYFKMVDASNIGQAIASQWTATVPSLMKWLGIGLIAIIVLVGFYFAFLMFQYNIGVYKLVLGESTNSLGKKEWFVKRVVLTKARQAMQKGVPYYEFWMSKLRTDPIPSRFLFPFGGFFIKSAGFVYEMDKEVYVPSAVNFAINSPATVNFNPLPYDVRQAMVLKMKHTADKFSEQSFMSKYGNILMTMGVVLFCLILVGAVVFMTYKYVGSGLSQAASSAQALAEAMKNGGIQQFVAPK